MKNKLREAIEYMSACCNMTTLMGEYVGVLIRHAQSTLDGKDTPSEEAKDKTIREIYSTLQERDKKIQELTEEVERLKSERLNEGEVENIFREMYVPLYPRDKPISGMTSYEQGLYKQVKSIASALSNRIPTGSVGTETKTDWKKVAK
jgi:uncharacterized small protein (DUF1192 family)